MIGRIIGILVLCFLVGLLLSALGITAQNILTDTWNTLLDLFAMIENFARWALPYTLLGAVIVVPVTLLRLLRRRGSR